MALPVTFDHCVVHVSDWERSNAFYRDVLGAELVRRPQGWAYRFGAAQLNLHGPGFHPAEVARLPVQPGNSDLCFEWNGPIADAIDHLARCRVAVHAGPIERFGPRAGTSVYFRDPDGSLLEFISYAQAGGRSRRPRTTPTSCLPIFQSRATTAPRVISPAGSCRRSRSRQRMDRASSVQAARPHGGLRLSSHRCAGAGVARRLGPDPRRARLHAQSCAFREPFRRAQAARRGAALWSVDAGHRLSKRGRRAAAPAVSAALRPEARARACARSADLYGGRDDSSNAWPGSSTWRHHQGVLSGVPP